PDDVVAAPGGFHVVGAAARTLAWRAVAEAAYRMGALPADMEPGLEATRFFEAPGEVWSSGAFVVAVRVERETGVIVPERIVWVDDAGTIVNPLLADGQLEGSLAQAWGQIVMEAIQFDGDGHLLTGTLMDYAIPRARARRRRLERVASRRRHRGRLRLHLPGPRASRLPAHDGAGVRLPRRRDRAQAPRGDADLRGGDGRRHVLALRHAAARAAAAGTVRVLMLETLANLGTGFSVALSPPILFYAFIGCVVGT